MIDIFSDGLGELYHHAKFGEDRTTCAGCTCENMVFVCFLSYSKAGTLFVRGVDSSNKHCIAVYRPISTRFSAFFQKGLLIQVHYIVPIFVARWRHKVHEIAVKNFEKSKNMWKSLCAPLRIDS